METFRFLKFQVYIEARHFYRDILSLCLTIKNGSLRNQLERASLSVCLNIAEGSAKKSDKDFARYLQISIGSLNEVVACLDVMNQMNLLDACKQKVFLVHAENIAKQLGGFIKQLSKS